MKSLRQAYAPRLPNRSSSAIALTSDGRTLLVVNPDSNSLTLVGTARRAVLAEVPVGLDPRTVAVDDAGRWAYVANREGESVSVVDLAARQVSAEVGVGGRPYGVVVSPGGDRVYVVGLSFDAALTPDSDELWVVNAASNDVSVIGLGSGRLVAHIEVGGNPRGIVIAPDGITGRPRSRLARHSCPVSWSTGDVAGPRPARRPRLSPTRGVRADVSSPTVVPVLQRSLHPRHRGDPPGVR